MSETTGSSLQLPRSAPAPASEATVYLMALQASLTQADWLAQTGMMLEIMLHVIMPSCMPGPG